MAGRVRSPRLVGRETELEALRSTLVRAPDDGRCIVLVSGEAGIGKSRLLDEFARSPGSDALILRAAGLEIGATIPFAPALELLDALAIARPELVGDIDEIRSDLSGEEEERTSGVVPSGGRRFRTFTRTAALLTELAREERVAILVDDLHWSDRSTLDLMIFLARRLGDARVLLVLAYRSDELHRRHPLKPVLADLERTSVLDHLRVEPLDDAEVAAQVESILGAHPSRELVERVVSTADGNPFHVEESLAADPGSGRVSPLLRDILLSRLDGLDDATMVCLRDAAVVGRDVDERLLAAASGRDLAAVRAALSAAVDAHLLEPLPDGVRYRFRHALLREAVYQDLLPRDRVGLHRRIAEVLTEHPEYGSRSGAVAAAERAHHWDAGLAPEHAIPALVTAGRACEAAFAWSEAGAAYERALELAAAEPSEAPTLIDDPIDIRRRAARMAYFIGRPRRAVALMREAAAAVPPEDPGLAGSCLSEAAYYATELGDYVLAEQLGEAADTLVPASPDSPERAFVLVRNSGGFMIDALARKGLEVATAGIEMARACGAPDAELFGLSSRSNCYVLLGRLDEGFADLEDAIRLAEEADDPDFYSIVLVNGAYSLAYAGRMDESIAMARRGRELAQRFGVEESANSWYDMIDAEVCWWTGQWDRAMEVLELAASTHMAGLPEAEGAALLLDIRAARGEPGVSEEANGRVRLDGSQPIYLQRIFRLAAALAAAWSGDPRSALNAASVGLDGFEEMEDTWLDLVFLWLAVRASADLALAEPHATDLRAVQVRASEMLVRAQALRDGTAIPSVGHIPMWDAWAELTQAEHLRGEGAESVDAWRQTSTGFDGLHFPLFAAYARARLAEALVRAGRKEEATMELAEARTTAERLRAAPLIAQIDALGRAARLSMRSPELALNGPVPVVRAPVPDPWGLSPREREVLALVAEGQTNRQVADALFISEKTASVHVTHILTKLGVASRVEAALAANRAGMFDQRS